MKADDAKELKELQRENWRLKKIVADQALDIDMLKELNRTNSDPEREAPGRSPASRALRGFREKSLPGDRTTPLDTTPCADSVFG
jgi:hypothetical protein